MIWLQILSVTGFVLFFYSYIGYPVCLMMLAGFVQIKRDFQYATKRLDRRHAISPDVPRVAVIIAAYNEEKHIEARVKNLFQLEYPADKLRFYIGSDGSSDRTDAILSSFDDDRLVACLFDLNRGKASVLNDLVSRADADVLVFSDANTFFSPDALRILVGPLADPDVGCVSGELRLVSSGGTNQDGAYWRIEQLLKFFESRIGGLLGANGAIYAVRRSLWKPLQSDTICDDFCVGMNVAASGAQLVYMPLALAYEDMPESISDEYHRRVRIGIGNYQSLIRNPEYLLRTSWPTKFSYVSHKVLRWIAPHVLLISLLASGLLALTYQTWIDWFVVQCVCFLAAWAAYKAAGRVSSPLPSLVKMVGFLFALNWAFLVASWRFISGNYSGSWRRTRR